VKYAPRRKTLYKREKKLVPCEEGAEVEQRVEHLAYNVTLNNEVKTLK
jgi:hypothetical protein